MKKVIEGEHMDAYTRLTDSILHQIMATPEADKVMERQSVWSIINDVIDLTGKRDN